MKDYYQRLNIAPYADDQTVRGALAVSDPPLRSEAEFILLEPRRRRIYDRDHKLLATISQLRMHMGLNYTKFWARQEYRDFWSELSPIASKPAGRRVDAMLIVQAFGAVGRHGRRHATKPLSWLFLLAIVCVAAAALIVWNITR
jgi:hypothetical protein